ncbi:hypothetical protein WJX79_007210 [Trebouxia sp. C0005]
MDALMRASRGDVEDPRPSDAMDDAQADLDTPLLESVTPEEAVAADVRTARPSTSTTRKPSFRAAVQDIQVARQHLNRAGSTSLAELTDEEKRAKVLGMFSSISNSSAWRTGTGTGLMKEQITDDHQGGPGWFSFKTDASAIYSLVMSSWLNILLVTAPLGILAHFLHWSPVAVFLLNFAALIPLALLLGEVTEDLAVRFGSTIGGLLNATFGNIVELILSIAALTKGLYVVIAASLIGSILSNLLLVLGCCFLLVNPEMTEHAVANMSHATALILGFVYMCYLFFQLKTHADELAEGGGDEAPALSLFGALAMLTCITLVVATNSEFLTGAIEAVSKSSGLNETFLGDILLQEADRR